MQCFDYCFSPQSQMMVLSLLLACRCTEFIWIQQNNARYKFKPILITMIIAQVEAPHKSKLNWARATYNLKSRTHLQDQLLRPKHWLTKKGLQTTYGSRLVFIGADLQINYRRLHNQLSRPQGINHCKRERERKVIHCWALNASAKNGKKCFD